MCAKLGIIRQVLKRIQRAENLVQIFSHHVGIYFRCLDICVTHQFLYNTDIRTVFQ